VVQEVAGALRNPSGRAFDSLTLALALFFLAGVSLATHFTLQPAIGFILTPLPLIFYRLDTVRFMFLSLASYILFFEAFKPGSNFLHFNTPDALFLVFVLLRLVYRKDFTGFRLPWSGLLLPMYLFIAYGFAMTVPGLAKYGLDVYVLRDFKNLAYLCLAAILCRPGEPLFRAGNIYRILILFVILAAGHSLVVLVQFLIDGRRIVSWNEVIIADAVLMSVALLPVARGARLRLVLVAALAVNSVGLIATQTRGLWGSVLISLAAYAAVKMMRGGFNPRAVLKGTQAVLLMAILAEAVTRLSVGIGLLEFISMRAMAFSPGELVDPYSSLGYRIHESLVVWEKRSLFGHGSGARLYLFFTQLQINGFLDWWSIHSEYFEILHKYGFVGLGLFLWFLLALARRALSLSLSRRTLPSALGLVAMATVLNHSLVSITSGYLIRENVMLWLVLMVGIVDRYQPLAASAKARSSRAGRRGGSPAG
jgi:O-antigen ligase